MPNADAVRMAAIDAAVRDEIAAFRCPKCGEANRVHFMSGGTFNGFNAKCDACGNQWNPPPPWAQPPTAQMQS